MNMVEPSRRAGARSPAKRCRVLAELRPAVLEQCAIEFRERWPHLAPEDVPTYFAKYVPEVDWDRRGRKALALLQGTLSKAWKLLGRLPDEDHPLGPYGRIARDLTGVVRFFESDLVELWAKEMFREAEAKEYCEYHWEGGIDIEQIPLLAGTQVTFRQAVATVFRFECTRVGGEHAKMPTARELAAASLLAGQALPAPVARGMTVFEIINRETKAMREVMRGLPASVARRAAASGS